jgi:hypothetical protein
MMNKLAHISSTAETKCVIKLKIILMNKLAHTASIIALELERNDRSPNRQAKNQQIHYFIENN